METEKEKELWKLAKKRVAFKRHLYTYILINLLLWGIWLINPNQKHHSQIPWPLWSTIGWGIGVLFNFASVYLFDNSRSVEKEYNKLRNKN